MDRLIAPPMKSTPVPTGAPGPEPRAIPDDLLREAASRLTAMAVIGMALWVTGPVLWHLTRYLQFPNDPRWHQIRRPEIVSMVNLVLNAGLWRWARRTTRDHRFILDVGVAYQILSSLSISLMWHMDPAVREAPVLPTITWVGIVILSFAAIIPNPPRRVLVSGLVSATMMPLAMLLERSSGWDFGSPAKVILMHYPDYMLVGVAVAISNVVTRLGQHISRAREMGSYHLGEPIGKGGMGEVYRATHRMLHRPAAIKLIRREVAERESGEAALAITRFRREAEVAASLQCPHTVALYDFGTTDDGALYFVMELLAGMDLERLVREHGPQTPARVVHILRQVCESLEEAHQRGLVHRDIKPANIHIGKLGLEYDFVKVLDFGLVKAVGAVEQKPTLATAAGIAPGTPDFMAPEMTLGEAVDGRADLYALGCVGWFLLTGRPVFEGNNAYHMIAMHLNEEPRRPSSLAPAPIPSALEDLVMACLKKRPEERPRSAADLARSLEAANAGPWDQSDAAIWWKSRIKE